MKLEKIRKEKQKIFKKRKIKVHFICKNLKGNLTNKIKFRGYNLHLIKNVKNSNYEDYVNTKKILEKFKNETCYLVIDNYRWDEKYEQKIRFLVEKIIVIDDLANRKHDCDLIIDQNLYSKFERRYDNLVPKNCHKLLGPKYVLLRKEFLTSKKKTQINSTNKIFVSFGGNDNSTFEKFLAGRPDPSAGGIIYSKNSLWSIATSSFPCYLLHLYINIKHFRVWQKD